MVKTFGAAIGWFILASCTLQAGEVYRVTSNDGRKTVTYEVRFGGGRLNDQFTAFDPETKKFVYLEWKRGESPPAPAMKIWDHQTGETISLYRFPKAKHPLPVIPSMESMRVCPITMDKKFKAKLYAMFD